MPELPEVETTRRGIAPHIEGRQLTNVIVRQTQLRWPLPPNLSHKLKSQTLERIDRRGKYLLFRFTHGYLLIHLGMSGSLRIANPETTSAMAHDHVDFFFGHRCVMRYHDPRRFGAILWHDVKDTIEEHPLLHHLGPEPLTDNFNPDYLFRRSRKRKKDVKAFIMDNTVVVGVGNIYANEALFSAEIRPTKPAGRLTKKNCTVLVDNIERILQHAIDQGGTTLRDFVNGDGKPGYFKQQLNVYGRGGEICKTCGERLKQIRQGQRTTVYCKKCQF